MKKELEPFYAALHRRGVTLNTLAAELQTTHGHLSQVFTGSRGKHTRKHIVKLLTPEEIGLLGWAENRRLPIADRQAGGDLSRVEHSST